MCDTRFLPPSIPSKWRGLRGLAVRWDSPGLGQLLLRREALGLGKLLPGLRVRVRMRGGVGQEGRLEDHPQGPPARPPGGAALERWRGATQRLIDEAFTAHTKARQWRLEMSRETEAAEGAGRAAFAHVTREIKRLNHLTGRYLELSRGRRAELNPCDPIELLKDVILSENQALQNAGVEIETNQY